MFADCFERYADRPCVADGDRVLGYAELLELGRAKIAGLPRARSFVALRCSLTIEAVAAYAALLVDGHVPLLLEADLSDELLRQMLDLYRPDAVVDPAGGGLTRLSTEAIDLHPDLGLLLTTSGSTGSPKLVRLKTAGVRANADAIASYLGLTADERPLLHLPMSYSYGMSVINSHLVSGGCICLTQRSVMEPGYWDDLRTHAATSISGVPFHYMAVRRLGEARLDIPSLRTLTQAGGRLDPKLAGFFADWTQRTGRRFFIMYGQTEAGPRIAYLPPERAADAADAIGVPIPGVAITLVDEEGAVVPDGQPGEMLVNGPAVMMGYATAPADLTRGDDLGGVLHTGDVAVKGDDGLYRIVGRRSRILKIYGLRVNVEEIERRLAEMGHSAFCFGEDDKLKVLIEGEGDAVAIRQQIVALFSLPPRGIEVRSGGVVARAASGKVAAAALQGAWEAVAA
jgi:acyl-CoA synthetase (AMP-forming)/AMP-acid ligase II